MYTQCPDCTTAFRVTAEVLKQAAGKVRCGGCGHAFNALLYLTETKPGARPRQPVSESLPELRPEPAEAETRDSVRPPLSAAQSAALLKTLDQLAGEDVRLEDTGVEWRLLGQDDDEANNDAKAFADTGLDFSDDAAAAIGVEESDGEVIEFTFTGGLADADDDFSSDQLFADTNAPLDRALFRAATESRVDEILNNAPTPVDELLNASPGDVDAVEVFTDTGVSEVEAQDVFASPETRPEDVLRFDDNTGLPDNFDLDAAAAALSTAAAQPATSADESSALQPEIAFGDPDEWGDLLEEVEPLVAAAPAPERELFADTGMHFSMQDDEPSREPAAPVLTLADELAALPDAPDDDFDRIGEAPIDEFTAAYRDETDETQVDPVAGNYEDAIGDMPIEQTAAMADAERSGEVPIDPVAAAGIDLSGIYATPARGDSDPTGDAAREPPAETAGNSGELHLAEAVYAAERPRTRRNSRRSSCWSKTKWRRPWRPTRRSQNSMTWMAATKRLRRAQPGNRSSWPQRRQASRRRRARPEAKPRFPRRPANSNSNSRPPVCAEPMSRSSTPRAPSCPCPRKKSIRSTC